MAEAAEAAAATRSPTAAATRSPGVAAAESPGGAAAMAEQAEEGSMESSGLSPPPARRGLRWRGRPVACYISRRVGSSGAVDAQSTPAVCCIVWLLNLVRFPLIL
jgi:hypothetical protein